MLDTAIEQGTEQVSNQAFTQIIEQAETHFALRELAAAEALFQQAHTAYPDRAADGLWKCAMLQGDFEAAWRITDNFRARNPFDPTQLWQGESIVGKHVIVRCLHGFGDALMFLRYLPALNLLAASVTVEAHPPVVPLLRHLAGATCVIPWTAGTPFDVQMEVMELPSFFHTQPAELPFASRYLHLPGIALPATQKLRIGLVWTAGEWNLARALPPELLAPLLDVRGCEFWNLTNHDAPWPLHEVAEARTDLVVLAGLVASMDLVLTTDTLVAHLAGALGVRAWVMLEQAADWRWQLERTDSPWYPSLRLFRQPQPGNWPALVQTLRSALQQDVRVSR